MPYVILSNTGNWDADMLGVIGVSMDGDLVKFIRLNTDHLEDELDVLDTKYDQAELLNDLEMDVIANGEIVRIVATKELDVMPDVFVMVDV